MRRNERVSFDESQESSRVLAELALIVNSPAYRSRGASRNLAANAASDSFSDTELAEARAIAGVDKIAALGLTEQHLDPITDLVDVESLGEGAFATVGLCRTTKRCAFPRGSHAARTGLVACKRLRPECVLNEPLEYDNFMAEAALMKPLVHANVVECYGCIEHVSACGAQCATILLEYLPGGSLRTRIGRRDYTGAQAVRWLVEIADGMAYLHDVADLGVAHRDLKPDNIVLDEFGVAKILDMGMARIDMRAPSGESHNVELELNYSAEAAAAPDQSHSAPRGALDRSSQSFSVTCRTGTPRYMAPENWAGRSYTLKVDVFSYAILAYEVLSGQRAYSELAMNGQTLADAVAEAGLRPRVPAEWPEALVLLLGQCWQEDPDLRPDFGMIARRLRAFEEEAGREPALLSSLVGAHRLRPDLERSSRSEGRRGRASASREQSRVHPAGAPGPPAPSGKAKGSAGRGRSCACTIS